ncbi:2'-5' RNA ligase family protein [Parafilimonas terrae]|uniref:2'-5' RNA ligase n=1 Tax=Parafilimonas terrae TaxID=1465490 RepID=A0A1I5VLN6_9BACT|nr:2'-5' RNA ligase family protein [Parafilimonas terrae]SFQ08454.1 2'-5' RNA ligase [Parafilimonas terrae]
MKNPFIIQEYLSEAEARAEKHVLPAEYLLVLQPHEALWDEIKSIKEKFATDYSCEQARKGLPHITLARFKQFQSTETHIRHHLRNNARTIAPFKIELKDFGSFPSHTIYINIASKVPIMNAVKTLRQNAQKFMKMDKDNKPHFITEPHLTIARKLQPWQYEKSWLEYEHANFHGRFIAGYALLLKRKAGEYYKQVEKFAFEGVKEEVKQANLFDAETPALRVK